MAEQPLANLDVSLDDPVERPAVEKLIRAAGDHSRRVHLLAGKRYNPFGEFLDCGNPDTQLYEMESHAPS